MPLLSLKTQELAHFCRDKNKGIGNYNQYINQRENQIQLHLSPPNKNKKLLNGSCCFHVIFILRRQKSNVNICTIHLINVISLSKHPPVIGGYLLKVSVGYNPNEYECRRRESNPHSRREHDFESCASAYSATSA
jgi:hypothetical protein